MEESRSLRTALVDLPGTPRRPGYCGLLACRRKLVGVSVKPLNDVGVVIN